MERSIGTCSHLLGKYLALRSYLEKLFFAIDPPRNFERKLHLFPTVVLHENDGSPVRVGRMWAFV